MTRYQMPRLSGPRTLDRLYRRGEDCREWYTFARAQVVTGSAILNTSPQRFAELLALFSPRVSVTRNIRMAVHYVRTGEHLHDVMSGIRVAVEHYESTGEIRGPKCRAFADAIMGDEDSVVLDTWMGVAFGVDSKRFDAKTLRIECERRIRSVATRQGATPAQAQAAIWAGAVREAGRNVPEFLIESEFDLPSF